MNLEFVLTSRSLWSAESVLDMASYLNTDDSSSLFKNFHSLLIIFAVQAGVIDLHGCLQSKSS